MDQNGKSLLKEKTQALSPHFPIPPCCLLPSRTTVGSARKMTTSLFFLSCYQGHHFAPAPIIVSRQPMLLPLPPKSSSSALLLPSHWEITKDHWKSYKRGRSSLQNMCPDTLPRSSSRRNLIKIRQESKPWKSLNKVHYVYCMFDSYHFS